MAGNNLGRTWMLATFLGAAVLVAVFAIRLGLGALHWSTDADRSVEGWMSVGYVAQVWDVPRPVLAEAIGIEQGDAPRQSISRIAWTRGETVPALIARIEAAIAAHRDSDRD